MSPLASAAVMVPAPGGGGEKQEGRGIDEGYWFPPRQRLVVIPEIMVAPLKHAVGGPRFLAHTRRFVEPHGISQGVCRFVEESEHPLAVAEMQIKGGQQFGVAERYGHYLVPNQEVVVVGNSQEEPKHDPLIDDQPDAPVPVTFRVRHDVEECNRLLEVGCGLLHRV